MYERGIKAGLPHIKRSYINLQSDLCVLLNTILFTRYSC
jgi:hypothetical protein